MRVVTQTEITAFPLLSRGKVRDIYGIDEHTLLIVTTDRMSAFDVIMDRPIPYKGVILNKITLFWMDRFAPSVSSHLLERDVDRFPSALAPWREELEGRAVLVRKAEPLPVECIVRAFLVGSGWKDYKATGRLCGRILPEGLVEAARLAPPLFTPSTKAEHGAHDENISEENAAALTGKERFAEVKRLSLAIFEEGSAYAEGRGILMADTKFEFGIIDGRLHLIDEVMTPDSSRFWPAARYQAGHGQPSFDKQYLRDWLETRPWDKKAPPPPLSDEVVEITARKYREAYTLLTGLPFEV